jgi:two-component system, OmpR family, sensor kinase
MTGRPGRRPWTLRRRLVVGVVALFTLLSIVVGGISVVVLYGNLTTPINQQLQRSAGFLERRAGVGPGSGNANGAGFPAGGGIVGQEPGSITVYSLAGRLSGQQSATIAGSKSTLTQAELAPFLQIKKSDTISDITVPGIGNFRVIRTAKVNLAESDRTTGALLATGKGYIYSAYPLDQAQSTLTAFGLTLGAISLGGILLVAFATLFIVSYALRPLRRVAATAAEVASMELDRGEVDLSVRVPEADTDTRTEVGQVGAALNTMLGHVDDALQARQASESRVRQFVADASHELRTPLASIRGYAELTRRGNYDLPDDVTHSLGRVESEAVRMTSLVEDLLLLARLDAGRDIETEPVDLTRVLVDSVSDAHAAGPDHTWELGALDEPLFVEGDAQRLHQVFVNLLANARVHTPAGTRVKIGLERRLDKTTGPTAGATAVVTITDNGPGIPKALQGDLFERFARGDSSRSRASGSTGLGLAIVKAVVDAHRGTVGVTSRKGNTTFRVELPLADATLET